MNPKILVMIFLVASALGGEARTHGGKDGVRAGRESPHSRQTNAERRFLKKAGDHLFNNMRQGLTKMITSVIDVNLQEVCEAKSSGSNLIITSTFDASNMKDVSNELPTYVGAFQKYNTDLFLTDYRDKLVVKGRKHQEADKNSKEWGKAIRNLDSIIIRCVGKLIDIPTQDRGLWQKTLQDCKLELQGEIEQIINTKAYIDKDVLIYILQNGGDKTFIDQVDNHYQKILRGLLEKFEKMAWEAAVFEQKHYE